MWMKGDSWMGRKECGDEWTKFVTWNMRMGWGEYGVEVNGKGGTMHGDLRTSMIIINFKLWYC